MAPKRPSPLEEPPSASETEEEDDSEEDEESPEPVHSSLKNPKPKPKPNPTPPRAPLPKPQPQPQPSSCSTDSDNSDDETPKPNPKPNTPKEDSDSEEDTSDSHSDNEPAKHQRSARVNPISSKPSTKSNKPPPSPAPAATPAPSKSASKRPLDDNGSAKSTKKKKASEIEDEGEDSEKKTAEDDKMPVAFERIWTEESEIVLLNKLIDYRKNGYKISNARALYDFIKDSLPLDVSMRQLVDKVQKSKVQYQLMASKAKPNEDHVISERVSSKSVLSRSHVIQVYRLSKQIWGEHSKDDVPHANHVGSESGKKDAKKNRAPAQDANHIGSESGKQDDVPHTNHIGSGLEYHFLNQSLKFRNGLTMPVLPQVLGDIAAKKGWDLTKKFDPISLNEWQKEVMIDETKAYLLRLDLVREQTKLMLDALVSADS